jgi:hypothetical protein
MYDLITNQVKLGQLWRCSSSACKIYVLANQLLENRYEEHKNLFILPN